MVKIKDNHLIKKSILIDNIGFSPQVGLSNLDIIKFWIDVFYVWCLSS